MTSQSRKQNNKSGQRTSLFFMALLPPQSLQDQITEIKLELKENFGCKQALKSPPHITVFPPFKWDVSQVDAFDGLAEFCQGQQTFDISLDGFGSFPPRVIYVHPIKSEPLVQFHHSLQDYLSQTLELVDPMVAKRGFTPHMTVANRDLKRDRFDDAWAQYQTRSLQTTFEVTALTLLKHNGQRWQICKQWPLGC